jgi:HAD superfamily hydrolase (TIGR01509 family)
VTANRVPVPEIVSFDLGNTLMRLPPQGGFCAHFSRTTGVPFGILRPLFAKYFHTRDLPIRCAVTLACQEIGYPNPNRVVDGYTPPAADVFDDVIPTLTRLREAGVKIIAISNCAPWDASAIAPTGLTPLLDEIFCSFQIGAAKPDPRIFRQVQARIKAKPEDLLHIGDTPTADVQGATSAGWSALLLDRDGNKVPARQNNPIRVIRTLADLVVAD